ncbi:hypothetical protein [Anaerobacillus alkalidiazotrophicus]|nr:hypothetical protein [Anaerobacillus alkalidiazotrophicus]
MKKKSSEINKLKNNQQEPHSIEISETGYGYVPTDSTTEAEKINQIEDEN